ncbi:unnamed protein product [Meloidogyne enterolobii]|uniref:Uncharacterized protein n=1 Tax=Meloidogyne enterolobii TaxID=390850 RepID=A0ACB0XZS2_MELEN
MASSLSFEQLKVTINSSPESALIHKDVEHQFKLLREHISSLDIKTVTQGLNLFYDLELGLGERDSNWSWVRFSADR